MSTIPSGSREPIAGRDCPPPQADVQGRDRPEPDSESKARFDEALEQPGAPAPRCDKGDARSAGEADARPAPDAASALLAAGLALPAVAQGTQASGAIIQAATPAAIASALAGLASGTDPAADLSLLLAVPEQAAVPMDIRCAAEGVAIAWGGAPGAAPLPADDLAAVGLAALAATATAGAGDPATAMALLVGRMPGGDGAAGREAAQAALGALALAAQDPVGRIEVRLPGGAQVDLSQAQGRLTLAVTLDGPAQSLPMPGAFRPVAQPSAAAQARGDAGDATRGSEEAAAAIVAAGLVPTAAAQAAAVAPPDPAAEAAQLRAANAQLVDQIQAAVSRFMVGQGPQGAAQVRMTLNSEVLPGVTVVVHQAAGRLQVEFHCADDQSRRRLQAVSSRMAPELAQRLGRDVLLQVTDDGMGDLDSREDREPLEVLGQP